jgi:hypothetical protein
MRADVSRRHIAMPTALIAGHDVEGWRWPHRYDQHEDGNAHHSHQNKHSKRLFHGAFPIQRPVLTDEPANEPRE